MYTTKISAAGFVLSERFLPSRSTVGTSSKRQILTTLAVLVLPLLAAPAVMAQEAGSYVENGWSLGMSGGRGVSDINIEALRAELASDGFDVLAIDDDRHSHGYKIFIGYQFHPNIGLEGGYFDLGDFKSFSSTLPETMLRGDTQQKGWNLDLVGTLPFTERFSGLARAGVTRNQQRASFRSNGAVDHSSYNDKNNFSSYKVGLGLQYDISEAFSLRMEAERYMMEDVIGISGDTDLYSLGFVYRIGDMSRAEPRPAPVTARTAATTQVAAEVRAEPIVLALEDVHFNFDTSELTDDTKEILRQHVRTLAANPKAKVRIAGYTSASGTAEYNQALSERRAASIKAFLVKEGLNSNRFKTVGFGASNPAEYEARPSVLRSDAAKANMRGLFEIIVE